MKQARFSSSFMFGFVAILLFAFLATGYTVVGRSTTGFTMIGWGAILGIMGGGLPALLIVCFERQRKEGLSGRDNATLAPFYNSALQGFTSDVLPPIQRTQKAKFVVVSPLRAQIVHRLRLLASSRK